MSFPLSLSTLPNCDDFLLLRPPPPSLPCALISLCLDVWTLCLNPQRSFPGR